MTGTFTQLPEIPDRIDDAPTEVMEPDTIDHHPRDQWMFSAGQVTCISQPSPGRFQGCIVGGYGERMLLIQYGQLTGLDLLGRLRVVSPSKEKRGRGMVLGLRESTDKEFLGDGAANLLGFLGKLIQFFLSCCFLWCYFFLCFVCYFCFLLGCCLLFLLLFLVLILCSLSCSHF